MIEVFNNKQIWTVINGFCLFFFFRSLFTVLVIYFLLACWSAGTAISSGLVVPML